MKMKRIFEGILFSLLLCVMLCACADGCDGFAWLGDIEATEPAATLKPDRGTCKHSFGEYKVPPTAQCNRTYVSHAVCSKCGEVTYGDDMRGNHRFGDDGKCIYCGMLDMKIGVEYREGDFLYFLRSKNRCEAILAEDAASETVEFPSSFGGHDISIISMPSSEEVRNRVKHVYIPASVEMTSQYIFKSFTALETVSIEQDSKLGSVGYEAFAGCSSLKRIELENCTALAKIGARAFADCTSLEEIALPDSVKMIEERAFIGCSALKKVSLESEYVGLGVGVFMDCSSLSNVNFLNKVETIPGSAFAGCKGLTRIRIPDNVRYIEDYAFEESGLLEVALPQSLLSLGNMAFFNCKSLCAIEIYDGIKRINTSTFAGCDALSRVILPSTLETIAPSAFADCASLKSIVIPASVKDIAANAFYLDTALEAVIFENVDGWVKGNEAISPETLSDPELAAKILREGVTSESFLRIEESVD
jgi:hypothetical protein